MRIVGICGGSASGKTTLALQLQSILGSQNCSFISLDQYYRTFDPVEIERGKVNFDHPDSIEIELLAQHLNVLQQGHRVDTPMYDYTHHRRTAEKIIVLPTEVIIVEGLFLFNQTMLNPFFYRRIFLDIAADIRLIRRIRRDTLERGRTIDSVLAQYESDVRPMYQKYIQPNAALADICLNENPTEARVEKLPSSFINK